MTKGERIDYSLPEALNLGAFYLDGNLEAGRGDRVAIYFEDRTLSFLDLWRLTNRVGNVLLEAGVEPGNRVLLILDDSPEWAASWLAAMKIGGVGTHAYTYLQPHDYGHFLDLVRPKVVVVDATALDRVRAAAAGRPYPKVMLVAGEDVPALRQGELSLAELIRGAGDRLDAEPTHRDDLAFWNFSGGTTGKPKGVPHMHRDGVIAYESFNHVLGYDGDDIVLRVPKLFFHYAREHFLFALRNGAASILFRQRTTTELVFDLIRRHRPTILVNVPTMMRSMIQTPAEARADLSSIRRCMSSGELLPRALHEEWLATFGGEVVNRFGSAESCMGYLCNRPGAVMPGSAGTVAPLAEVRLVDDDGREAPRGRPGLLMVRCDCAGRYYERDHEKSLATFRGDGWIDTGDIFMQDDDGYFWYVGRANEMVKVSGIWVSPLEIEQGLQAFPGVREAAALGIADADGLMKIRAFVVLDDGLQVSAETPEALKRFCQERLAPHKFPSTIAFLDALPKTGQGKIDRLLLRERARPPSAVGG